MAPPCRLIICILEAVSPLAVSEGFILLFSLFPFAGMKPSSTVHYLRAHALADLVFLALADLVPWCNQALPKYVDPVIGQLMAVCAKKVIQDINEGNNVGNKHASYYNISYL